MKFSSLRRHSGGLILVATLLLGGGCAVERVDSLARFKDYKAGRASSSDPTGGNADNVRIAPGQTAVLAELEGPGCVSHIWMTHLYAARGGLRKLVLRAYFDDAETPCVECPLGDFFGLGHAQTYAYDSGRLAVGTWGGLNSFWPMPFKKYAKFTVTNEGPQVCDALYFHIDYERYPKPRGDLGYFHARYHQAMPCVKGEPYVVLEAAGRGHYVGCNLSIEQLEDNWWGEGDDRFFIDGDTRPTLEGTGSEDYFSGAWCYWHEFSYPNLGMPFRGRFTEDDLLVQYTPDIRREDAKDWHWPVAWRKGDLWNVYRYHFESPVPFRKSIRMELEHGYINNERQDAFSSVAYWYQDHPHGPQPPFPAWRERMPYYLRVHDRGDGRFEAEDFVDAAMASGGALVDPGMLFWGHGAFANDAVLEWRPEKEGDTLTLALPVPESGIYDLRIKPVRTSGSGMFDVRWNGRTIRTGLNLYHESIFPTVEEHDLAVSMLDKGEATLTFVYRGKNEKSSGTRLILDTVVLRRDSPPAEIPASAGGAR